MKNFLFGMLIGGCVALMYAPATGRRTRSLIRDKANKLGNDIEDFTEGKKRHLMNKMEGYKAKMRNMSETVRTAMAPSINEEPSMNGPSI